MLDTRLSSRPSQSTGVLSVSWTIAPGATPSTKGKVHPAMPHVPTRGTGRRMAQGGPCTGPSFNKSQARRSSEAELERGWSEVAQDLTANCAFDRHRER